MSLFKSRQARHAAIGYAFLLPNLLGFVIFLAGPILFSFLLSFFRWNIFAQPVFVDLANYARILFDPESGFWLYLGNTLFFMLGIPIGLAFSLVLALLVNQRLRGITIFRTLYFLPVVASMITVALLWEYILNREQGLLNQLLGLFGIKPLFWLGDPLLAKIGIMLMLIWKTAGYNMLIYLAALHGIPEEYYEAARMDGAGRVGQFLNITFPLLAPANFFLLVTGVIGTFQLFGPIYVLTDGGPGKGTWTLLWEIYWKAYREFNMGYAAAVSWILFALMFVVTLIQWRYVGRRVEYGV
jgi:multiple sugar transport system permease protein